MTNDHQTDRSSAGAGGRFFVGALGGLVVGVGLGLLLAPKTGAELRRGLSQSADDVTRAAQDSYRKASGKVHDSYQQVTGAVRETVERGRAVVNKAQEAWHEGRQDAADPIIPSIR